MPHSPSSNSPLPDHQRDQVQPGQVRGEQVGQGGLGHRHEPPRDRGPRGGRHSLRDALPDRFQADPVPAGRQPRQHPFHRHPPEDLGGGEHLVGRHGQLPGAVHRPDPGTLHGHPASAQGHRPGPGAVTDRDPSGVVPPARARQRGHVGVHQRAHHLQAGADRQREQPLAHVLGDVGHHHAHPVRHSQFERVTHTGVLPLILLGHGGPLSARVVFGGRPTPTPRQASGGGPPPQNPRDPGQPLRLSSAPFGSKVILAWPGRGATVRRQRPMPIRSWRTTSSGRPGQVKARSCDLMGMRPECCDGALDTPEHSA